SSVRPLSGCLKLLGTFPRLAPLLPCSCLVHSPSARRCTSLLPDASACILQNSVQDGLLRSPSVLWSPALCCGAGSSMHASTPLRLTENQKGGHPHAPHSASTSRRLCRTAASAASHG